MASISFLDFVFPQFTPQAWQSGISIYRAGGIIRFQSYGELVSAKAKAGIGEMYDVRLKLHAQGKCVQWMECTCQANRRRGEKCVHLAAFCLYLDQERSDVLIKMNLGTGASERFLMTDMRQAMASFADASLKGSEGPGSAGSPPGSGGSRAGESSRPGSGSATLPDGTSSSLGDGPGRLAQGHLESVLHSQATQVLALAFDETELSLQVTVVLEGKRKLTYRLGVDDAYRALIEPTLAEKIPKKLALALELGHVLKRFFSVKRHAKAGLRISRCVAVLAPDGTEKKAFELEDLEAGQAGRQACYFKKFGFVKFEDGMSAAQLSRWEEYPKTALLDGDTAAVLFQTGFQRLRETAEIRIAKELSKVEVLQALAIPEIKVKSTSDGYLLVEPTFQGVTLGAFEDGRTSVLGDTSATVGGIHAGTGGQAIGPGSVLLAVLKARAEGKQYLATKSGWVKISEDLDWLQSKLSADGKLKLSPLEFIKFREQFASSSEITGNGDVVSRIRGGLVSTKDLEMPSLKGTSLTLRPYQEEGVRWLWWLYKNGLGGLLADEMGLGKTHQAMALVAAVAAQEPQKLTLVVCPTSVIDHWLDKMTQFTPGTKVVCYHGTGRRQEALKSPREHKVIVTSYGILLRDVQFLMQCPWAIIILDEAHLVKNQTTRTYRAACRLPSRMRLCLTGTPLENDLMELKNLFDYIAPSYLGTDTEFKRKYLTPGEKAPLAELELQRLIHPFKMRRNKRDVLHDLPEKVEDIKHCHLRKEQHQLYMEALALKGRPLIDAIQSEQGPIPYIHVFSIISLLKQICNDPALVDPRYANVGSGKLDLFDELLREALESDQKVVVFSQYAKMIARLGQRLTEQGVSYVSLTGSSVNRGAIVREFQDNPKVKVFLGSLLAGGTGIDLTAGSVVIHYDRWWNAAKEDQATDRIHRIGQQRNVQVFKLVTKGTLEERIDEIINRKKLIFERFVEQDAEVFKHLSREDLLQLLAPPEKFSGLEDDEKEEATLESLIEDGGAEAYNL